MLSALYCGKQILSKGKYCTFCGHHHPRPLGGCCLGCPWAKCFPAASVLKVLGLGSTMGTVPVLAACQLGYVGDLELARFVMATLKLLQVP